MPKSSTSRKGWEECRGQIANWVLLLAGLINLACGTWAGLQENAGLAATLLAAGLILIFSGTIERFESLKGFGVEAITKKLDAKINEADNALIKLRELASLSGASMIQLEANAGPWAPEPDVSVSLEHAMRTKQLLQELGATNDEVFRVLHPWLDRLVYEIGLAILQPVRVEGYAHLNSLAAELKTLSSSARLTDDPELVAARRRHESLTHALAPFDSLNEWTPEESPYKLIQILSVVPEVSSSTLSRARKTVDEWASDCAWLTSRLELRSQDKWLEMIRNRSSVSFDLSSATGVPAGESAGTSQWDKREQKTQALTMA